MSGELTPYVIQRHQASLDAQTTAWVTPRIKRVRPLKSWEIALAKRCVRRNQSSPFDGDQLLDMLGLERDGD